MQPWEEKDFFLGESGYSNYMNTVGKAFREEHYEEGDFPGFDFRNLHYYKIRHPQEKAAIVISHGFCEFVHKYDEAILYYYRLGYSVYFLDHRGHGHSYREVDKVDLVHVEHFMDYVEDFKCFMDTIVKKESPNVDYYLFGHSMGGGIGAAFLETYPGYFKKAVLSSPLMQLNIGPLKPGGVKRLAFFAHFTGRYKKLAPANKPFDGVRVFETSSCQSRERYDYFFDYRLAVPEFSTYGGTLNWVGESLRLGDYVRKNADKVTIPVILFQAGLDRLVEPEGQDYFAAVSQNTKLIQFPNSKHEIFNAKDEDREAYYSVIFRFFAQK